MELDLPMPVRYSKAIDQVQANRDRIAITRGPLVYCAEQADNRRRGRRMNEPISSSGISSPNLLIRPISRRMSLKKGCSKASRESPSRRWRPLGIRSRRPPSS